MVVFTPLDMQHMLFIVQYLPESLILSELVNIATGGNSTTSLPSPNKLFGRKKPISTSSGSLPINTNTNSNNNNNNNSISNNTPTSPKNTPLPTIREFSTRKISTASSQDSDDVYYYYYYYI